MGKRKVTVQFVNDYLEKKMDENENYIVCTYYDVIVNEDVAEKEELKFLELSKNKLENNGYNVYFRGAKFVYENANRTVQDNELLIAIKEQ